MCARRNMNVSHRPRVRSRHVHEPCEMCSFILSLLLLLLLLFDWCSLRVEPCGVRTRDAIEGMEFLFGHHMSRYDIQFKRQLFWIRVWRSNMKFNWIGNWRNRITSFLTEIRDLCIKSKSAKINWSSTATLIKLNAHSVGKAVCIESWFISSYKIEFANFHLSTVFKLRGFLPFLGEKYNRSKSWWPVSTVAYVYKDNNETHKEENCQNWSTKQQNVVQSSTFFPYKYKYIICTNILSPHIPYDMYVTAV